MREAFLTQEAVFVRTKPLTKAEQHLLAEAQEPANKARYSYHDCEQHGIFKVDTELGLAAVDCPRRGKCRVREVFDPAGYAEHYTQTAPHKLTPAQELQLDQVLALGQQPGQSDEQLREQMEQILGCKVKGSAAEIMAALKQGLTRLPEDDGDKINRLLAEAEARDGQQTTDTGGFPPSELKRRLERILKVEIPATPEEIAQGMREGMAFVDYHKAQRPDDEPQEPAEPAEPQLTDIEHYASLQFPPAQICLVLGLDLATEGQTPEFQQQIVRGQLIQLARLRGTIFQHANNGSAPAQTEALKLMAYARARKAGGYDDE